GNRLFLFGGCNKSGRPLLEVLRVLLVSRNARHDQDLRLLGERDSRRKEQGEPRSHEGTKKNLCRAPHARPLTRRNPHSAATRPTSSMNSAGMSQSSRSSTTVTPRPL